MSRNLYDKKYGHNKSGNNVRRSEKEGSTRQFGVAKKIRRGDETIPLDYVAGIPSCKQQVEISDSTVHETACPLLDKQSPDVIITREDRVPPKEPMLLQHPRPKESTGGHCRATDQETPSCEAILDTCDEYGNVGNLAYGELCVLPVPNAPWKEVALDFMTGLPRVKGSNVDSIVIVRDRHTERVKLLAVSGNIDAPKLAAVLVREICTEFGALEGMVSDRGLLLTDSYWSELGHELGQRLSTVLYTQTDGQIDGQNQILKSYLRIRCGEGGDEWPCWLELFEQAHNCSTIREV